MKKIGLVLVAATILLSSGRCRFANSSFFGDGRNGNYIKISNDGVHEEIKYEGEIRFNDDETAIDHISPNGYLMFTKDDERLLVESNYHGEITYELNDEGKKRSLDEQGQKVLSELIKEIIACGFDAEARMERIYKRGGNAALLNEIDHLKSDQTKAMYFDRILGADSLGIGELALIVRKISSQLGSDNEKEGLLDKFNRRDLQDPEISVAYLGAIETLGSDNAKENLLSKMIDKQNVTKENFTRFMTLVEHLGSDNAKENLIRAMINRQSVPPDRYDVIIATINHLGSDNVKSDLLQEMMRDKTVVSANFDKMIGVISSLGSDNEKSDLYRKFIDGNNLSEEEQWIALMNATTQMGSDNEKSNVLVLISEKMPASENTRAAFMKAAKSIGSDAEYGRVMKGRN